jgi:hypothetical protein
LVAFTHKSFTEVGAHKAGTACDDNTMGFCGQIMGHREKRHIPVYGSRGEILIPAIQVKPL